jgi:hypothetical protein
VSKVGVMEAGRRCAGLILNLRMPAWGAAVPNNREMKSHNMGWTRRVLTVGQLAGLVVRRVESRRVS